MWGSDSPFATLHDHYVTALILLGGHKKDVELSLSLLRTSETGERIREPTPKRGHPLIIPFSLKFPRFQKRESKRMLQMFFEVSQYINSVACRLLDKNRQTLTMKSYTNLYNSIQIYVDNVQ